MKNSTINRNVWEVCQERANSRYGLGGVNVRVVATGDEYTVRFSEWDEDKVLLLHLVPGLDALPKRRDQASKGSRWRGTPPADVTSQKHPSKGTFRADECILLSEWY
jgi:hypothetical protein